MKTPRATDRLFNGTGLYYGKLEPWDRDSWTFLRNHRFEDTDEAGKPVAWTSSDEGFFTPDNPPKEASQLIVLGDSFASMQNVSVMIPHALKKTTGLPVYSLASEGWGPDNYRLAFERLGRGRNAKAVVVFTFLNDLILDADLFEEWRSSNPERPYLQHYILKNLKAYVEKNASDSFLDRSSFLWNWLKYAAGKISRRSINNSTPFVPAKPLRLQLNPAKPALALSFQPHEFLSRDPSEFPKLGRDFENYRNAIGKLKAAIEAEGHSMLLVWIPTVERVFLPLMDEKMRKEFLHTPSGKIDGYENFLHELAAQEKIEFLSLVDALMEHARQGDSLYSNEDNHLNSWGNQVTAKAVADKLKQLKL